MSETQKRTPSEQARINGAKSRGPITPEGKAKSSANSIKHGFAATVNNVLAFEDQADFQLHLAGIRASYAPKNYMEETLVDQLASIGWRQARLVGLETSMIDAQMSLHHERVCAQHPDCADDDTFHLLQAWRALASPPRRRTEDAERDPSTPPAGYDMISMELLRRYQTSLDRQFRNTLLNLRQYRKDFVSDTASVPAKPDEPKEPTAPIPENAPTDAPKAKTIIIHPPSTVKNPSFNRAQRSRQPGDDHQQTLKH